MTEAVARFGYAFQSHVEGWVGVVFRIQKGRRVIRQWSLVKSSLAVWSQIGRRGRRAMRWRFRMLPARVHRTISRSVERVCGYSWMLRWRACCCAFAGRVELEQLSRSVVVVKGMMRRRSARRSRMQARARAIPHSMLYAYTTVMLIRMNPTRSQLLQQLTAKCNAQACIRFIHRPPRLHTLMSLALTSNFTSRQQRQPCRLSPKRPSRLEPNGGHVTWALHSTSLLAIRETNRAQCCDQVSCPLKAERHGVAHKKVWELPRSSQCTLLTHNPGHALHTFVVCGVSTSTK